MNTGSLFFFSVFFLISQGLVLLLRKLAYYHPHPKLVKMYRYLRSESSFTSMVFRFMIEGYIEFLVSCLLSFENFSKIDLLMTNLSDALTFFVGLIFFVIVLALPILIA